MGKKMVCVCVGEELSMPLAFFLSIVFTPKTYFFQSVIFHA